MDPGRATIVGAVIGAFALVGVAVLQRNELSQKKDDNNALVTQVEQLAKENTELQKRLQGYRADIGRLEKENRELGRRLVAAGLPEGPKPPDDKNGDDEKGIVSHQFEDPGQWPLSGTTRISGGKLAVTLAADQSAWISIPDVRAADKFTVQAEMTLVEGHFCQARYGFGLGEQPGSNYRFLAVGDCGNNGRVAYLKDGGAWFSAPAEIPLLRKRPYSVVLEVLDTLATLIVDGKRTETAPISRTGTHVALVALYEGRLSPRSATFKFDDIVFRPIP